MTQRESDPRPKTGFSRMAAILTTLKERITRLPIVGRWLRVAWSPIRRARFPGSGAYWERRYATGGTSGDGSYGELARFKAEVLNKFVVEHEVRSVIEFGCGDGNQLLLAEYPQYLGLDVSRTAIERCDRLFRADASKSFLLYDPAAFSDRARFLHADLAISLDVIFHLAEDEVFERYMADLFGAADRFVVIYSSNLESRTVSPHERHRHFTDWVSTRRPDWALVSTIRNVHPYRGDSRTGSRSDFYVYELRTP